MKFLIVVLLVIATPALAQPQQPYAALDRELWELMSKALADIPMALSAHQAVQNILTNVQREAIVREARAKQPTPPAPPPQSEEPK